MRMYQVKGDEFVCGLIESSPREREYGWKPREWRKIISGSTYSSETASSVACYSFDDITIATCHEELFQTPKGNFILVGDGESCSPWSKQLPDCNHYVRGNAFVPLSDDDTRKWLEVRGLDDEQAEIFGDPEQGATQILLKLSPVLVRRCNASAEASGISLQNWIQILMEKNATT